MKVVNDKTNYSKLLVGETKKKQEAIDLILSLQTPAIASAVEPLGRMFHQLAIDVKNTNIQHTLETAKSREIFETNLTIQVMKVIEEAVEKAVAKTIPIVVNGNIKRLSEKVDEYQKINESFMQEVRPMLNAFKEQNGAIAFGKKKLFGWARVFGAASAIVAGGFAIVQYIIKPILSSLK